MENAQQLPETQLKRGRGRDSLALPTPNPFPASAVCPVAKHHHKPGKQPPVEEKGEGKQADDKYTSEGRVEGSFRFVFFPPSVSCA